MPRHKYTPGTRVQTTRIQYTQPPMPAGTRGTVRSLYKDSPKDGYIFYYWVDFPTHGGLTLISEPNIRKTR